MMTKILAGGLIAMSLILSLFLAGCELPFLKAAEPPPPDSIPPVQFKGVPIPEEFEFLHDESWSHVAPSFRSGVMKYKGDVLLSRAKTFFATEMPAAGWETVEIRDPSRHAAVMKFSKGAENCIVTLRKVGGLTYLTVEINK